MQKELTQEIINKINELAEIGNEPFNNEKYHEAIITWQKALSLVPHPQNIYAQSQ